MTTNRSHPTLRSGSATLRRTSSGCSAASWSFSDNSQAWTILARDWPEGEDRDHVLVVVLGVAQVEGHFLQVGKCEVSASVCKCNECDWPKIELEVHSGSLICNITSFIDIGSAQRQPKSRPDPGTLLTNYIPSPIELFLDLAGLRWGNANVHRSKTARRRSKGDSEVRFVGAAQFFTKFWPIKSFYLIQIARKLAELWRTTSITGPSSTWGLPTLSSASDLVPKLSFTWPEVVHICRR